MESGIDRFRLEIECSITQTQYRDNVPHGSAFSIVIAFLQEPSLTTMIIDLGVIALNVNNVIIVRGDDLDLSRRNYAHSGTLISRWDVITRRV